MDDALAHDDMTDALIGLLDGVAQSQMDAPTLRALAGELRAWTQRIKAASTGAPGQPEPRGFDLIQRRGALTPPVTIIAQDDRSMRGVVTFGQRFGPEKPHGGAIPLLLLDVMGRLVNSGARPRSYTAQLLTHFRSVTPADTELGVRAWLVAEDGRKRRARIELWHNERLCAEAEGLFIAAATDPG